METAAAAAASVAGRQWSFWSRANLCALHGFLQAGGTWYDGVHALPFLFDVKSRDNKRLYGTTYVILLRFQKLHK